MKTTPEQRQSIATEQLLCKAALKCAPANEDVRVATTLCTLMLDLLADIDEQAKEIERLQAEARLNAAMLARQTDLAREAELECRILRATLSIAEQP